MVEGILNGWTVEGWRSETCNNPITHDALLVSLRHDDTES